METVLGVEIQPTVVKEPVMDVPAIDMNATVTAPKPVSTPARRKRAKRSVSSQRQPPHATQVKARAKRARDGSIGRDTFERVDALLRQGKNKTEAFKQIGDDTGKKSGTVAANYYRVARASGVVKSRKRRATTAPATAMRGRRQKATPNVGRGGRVSSGNGVDRVEQLVEQLVASVVALTGAVKAQDVELRELRGRVDGVRTLLR